MPIRNECYMCQPQCLCPKLGDLFLYMVKELLPKIHLFTRRMYLLSSQGVNKKKVIKQMSFLILESQKSQS